MADAIEPKTEARHDSQPLSADELSRLRVLIESKKAWWKDYPFLVSALAFVLSLTIAIVSAWTSYRKDVHDQQTQLSTEVQTIQDLLLKQAEVRQKYSGDPMSDTTIGMINAQLNSTLRTASDLALRLGSEVPTGELSILAQGLFNLGDVVESRRLLQAALQSARTANDESVALRYLGFLEVRDATSSRMRDSGEARFRAAVNLEDKYPEIGQFVPTVLYLKAVGELSWAAAIGPIDCGAARSHFREGQQILAKAPHVPDLDELRHEASLAFGSGIGGAPGCPPG